MFLVDLFFLIELFFLIDFLHEAALNVLDCKVWWTKVCSTLILNFYTSAEFHIQVEPVAGSKK